MKKTSSRWIIEIRGPAHDLYLDELNSKVQDISDTFSGAEISMDKEIDFSKAKRVKPLMRPEIEQLLVAVGNLVANWEDGDLAGAVNYLTTKAERVRKLYRKA